MTQTLDEHQTAVINYRAGHARVVAGAGSGKTRTLIHRAVALTQGPDAVAPEQVLLLAYNKSAAQTLRDRLAGLVPYYAERFSVDTFHAWCLRVLHQWFPQAPRLMRDRLIESPASKVFPLIEKNKLDLYWRDGLAANDVLTEALVDPFDEKRARARLQTLLGSADSNVLRFCQLWQEFKVREHYLEFCDMTGMVGREILSRGDHPHVQALRQLYVHVQVDEGQDTNRARHLITNWLSSFPSVRWPEISSALRAMPGACRSSVVVGDHRQSCYGFTGAEPDYFLDEDRELLVLPTNYRSTARVVEAGNRVVAGAPWNEDVRTSRCRPKPSAVTGEPVQVWTQTSAQEERAEIFDDVLQRRAENPTLRWSDFAILARTNALLVGLEVAGVARGVPVQVSGETGGIWGSSMGKAFLAYLRGAEDILDWALLDVVNKPKRFCKKAEVSAVLRGMTGKQGVQAALIGGPAPSSGIVRLANDLKALGLQPWSTRCKTIGRYVRSGQATGALKGSDQDVAAALDALTDAAVTLGSLAAIEAHHRAMAARSPDSVVLSTLHRAKGLEWPVVYVSGVRSGILPHKSALDHEEERRLLYVGITRAEEVCIITTGGKKSSFLAALE